MSIKQNYLNLRSEIPKEVTLVVAVKARTPQEIAEVIDAGATDIGENYVQEAEAHKLALGEKAKKVTWHMIGSLQTNKINKALATCDVIQTVDSFEKAQGIDKRVEAAGKKVVTVFIEVNIAEEISKAGASPQEKDILDLAKRISELKHLRLEGLMTMGPLSGDPEQSRPYFRFAKALLEKIKGQSPPEVGDSPFKLSMGMSHSYRVAIEEGATMVRIGTAIFGERK